MGLWDANNQKWEERINKAIAGLARDLKTKPSQKLKHMQACPKPLVRNLTIKEDLREETKETIEHNNQSYGEWCAQTDKEIMKTSFS